MSQGRRISMTRLYNPDAETIADLIREGDEPTAEQIAVGKLALDDIYNGTKDVDEETSIIHVYRAMTAIERRGTTGHAHHSRPHIPRAGGGDTTEPPHKGTAGRK